MNFTVHTLQLHRDIEEPHTGPVSDGTLAIFEYRSLVAKNDLEPPRSDHLTDGHPTGRIPAGYYLFTQGTAAAESDFERPDDETEALFRDAAEAVWLESLWRECPLKNDKILVRILSEDSKTVFQIFRAITDEASRP